MNENLNNVLANLQTQIDRLNNKIKQVFGDGSSSFYRQYYIYEAQALALAAGGTATDNIQIDSDADFIWTKATYEADIAAAAFTDSTRPIPNVNLQLNDTGSGRNFFNDVIPVPSMFGTGEIPFILPVQQRLRRNSTLQVNFTNFDAAVTYNLRLAFIGYKDFVTGDTAL